MQRECPYCAEKIQKRAKICRFCSTKVDPMYVENAAANKQICKIMDWHNAGNDSYAIAKLMNDSGERTLDSQETWSSDRIQTIVLSFSATGAQRVVDSSAPSRNVSASGNHRTAQLETSIVGEVGEPVESGNSKNNNNSKRVIGAITGVVVFLAILTSALNGKDASIPKENFLYSKYDLCRGLVGAHMANVGTKPLNMIYVSRRGDQPVVDHPGSYSPVQCRIEGNRIVWRNYPNGRWRNHPDDPVVTFSQVNRQLVFTESFNKNDSHAKAYSFSDFRK
ncbi:hypothetical protein ACJJIK_09050 [Microbulbifer sp. ZKSA006]|uniref:hypothetical protein n=1 Tax=Microbulbifer sp. ZKSA006 TaxID=3243390 RepID=UPI00403A5F71